MMSSTDLPDARSAADPAMAPDSEVMDAAGLLIPLSSFWQSGPAALVFVRHLGCLFCREQLKDLREHASTFERAGLALVVITPDRPNVVATFSASFHPPFPILSDPRRTAYQAYGLVEGSGRQLLNPHVVVRSLGALARGNMQGRTAEGSSRRQLPGAALVDRDGRLVYQQIANDAADHLSAAQLIAIARGHALVR